MKLSEIPLLTRSIPYNGVEIVVRGITFSDLTVLLPRYGAQLSLIAGKIKSGDGLDAKDFGAIVAFIAQNAPDLFADVIALATDDYPQGAKVAKTLPFNVQFEIASGIYECTFASESDLEKFSALVTRIVMAATSAIKTATMETLSTPTGGLSAAA